MGAREGDILDRIVPISELENTYLKLGVYGTNRVGKTTLACTFPKPLLLVAFELNQTGGALSVRRVAGVDFVQVRRTEEALRLADALKGMKKYKTVVLDTVTAYQDQFLREILNVDTLPEQLGFNGVGDGVYLSRAERTKEGIRPFLNLPCHTVVLAKEKDHNPPKIERVNPKTGKVQPDMRAKFLRGVGDASYVTFDLGGGTAGWLYDQLDYVGRLYLDSEVVLKETVRKVNGEDRKVEEAVETGRQVRRLLIKPTENFAAGFRSESPEGVPDTIEEPTYDKILAAIKNGEGN